MGSDPGQFFIPTGVAVGSDGRVYVTDQVNNRVQKFKPNGDYITEWGGGMGSFDSPTGITVTTGDDVLVCDTNHHRIQRFSSAGAFKTTTGFNSGAGPFSSPNGVAADLETGEVFVADSNYDRIKKLDANLQFVDRTFSDLQFDNPMAIAVRRNRVFVVDRNNHRIQKLTS